MHYLQDVEKRKAKIIEEAKGRYFGKEVKLVSMFEQTWGSTALGFGGIGGAAMTTAYTGIVQAGEDTFAVYFHERFAYEVTKPTDHFFKDMEKKRWQADEWRPYTTPTDTKANLLFVRKILRAQQGWPYSPANCSPAMKPK